MDENIYHFSFGNSTDGPVGYCASINAPDPETAVTLLREAVDKDNGGNFMLHEATYHDSPLKGSGYVEAYLNTKAITIADIDYWIDPDGNEHGCVIDTAKDCPVIIVEDGLVQNVVHLVNPEEDYEYMKFDLDCWEGDQCPTCYGTNLELVGAKPLYKKKSKRDLKRLFEKREQIGWTGGTLTCTECQSNKNMTTEELIMQWLIHEETIENGAFLDD